MTNRFYKHNFIENQAKLHFFDNFFVMHERSLTNKPAMASQAGRPKQHMHQSIYRV
jgi:hypothetical protein